MESQTGRGRGGRTRVVERGHGAADPLPLLGWGRGFGVEGGGEGERGVGHRAVLRLHRWYHRISRQYGRISRQYHRISVPRYRAIACATGRAVSQGGTATCPVTRGHAESQVSTTTSHARATMYLGW
eukprot:1550468-Rhodomonas_salina.4